MAQRRRGSDWLAQSVNFEIEGEKHFPFSICDLIFDIAGGDPDSMPNFHWAISGR
jgi:hypothetical protein